MNETCKCDMNLVKYIYSINSKKNVDKTVKYVYKYV